MLGLEAGVDHRPAGVIAPEHIAAPLVMEVEVVSHYGRPLVVLTELGESRKVRGGARGQMIKRVRVAACGREPREHVEVRAEGNVQRIEGGIVPGRLIAHRDYPATQLEHLPRGALLVPSVQLIQISGLKVVPRDFEENRAFDRREEIEERRTGWRRRRRRERKGWKGGGGYRRGWCGRVWLPNVVPATERCREGLEEELNLIRREARLARYCGESLSGGCGGVGRRSARRLSGVWVIRWVYWRWGHIFEYRSWFRGLQKAAVGTAGRLRFTVARSRDLKRNVRGALEVADFRARG